MEIENRGCGLLSIGGDCGFGVGVGLLTFWYCLLLRVIIYIGKRRYKLWPITNYAFRYHFSGKTTNLLAQDYQDLAW